ncbi:MAG: hypothetical protein KIT84_13435 [Labilithrix sp.]|nr:hypothetical protein [Labilithrix sp.]MCW5812020.1 hypothetical protein [Labilithrix sp.]
MSGSNVRSIRRLSGDMVVSVFTVPARSSNADHIFFARLSNGVGTWPPIVRASDVLRELFEATKSS